MTRSASTAKLKPWIVQRGGQVVDWGNWAITGGVAAAFGAMTISALREIRREWIAERGTAKGWYWYGAGLLILGYGGTVGWFAMMFWSFERFGWWGLPATALYMLALIWTFIRFGRWALPGDADRSSSGPAA